MSRRHLLHVAVLAVGLISFGLLLHRTGWTRIVDTIAGVGGWFGVIAAFDLVAVCCDAAAIHRVTAPHPVSYRAVFTAQFSGLAINRLTPGNTFGEPIKITMLLQHAPEATAVSAIVLFNLATYVVAIAVLVVGVPLTLLTLDLPPEVDAVVIAASVGLGVFAAALIALARRGALTTSIAAARRLRAISASRAAAWTERFRAIDAGIRRFGDPASRAALAYAGLSRACNMVGTLLILHAAGIPLTAPVVIGMLSVGILITWISNVVPLGLGLADGGTYVLYRALGASPEHGLDFAMINRVRTIILASIGLAVMTLANTVKTAPTTPPPPHPRAR